MSTASVLKYGESILRRKTKKVTDFSNLDSLVLLMFQTMKDEKGIGLAANQIGYDLSLLVVDINDLEENIDSKPMVIVNPLILKTEGEIEIEEGCLSIPNIRAKVKRPEIITLKYQDINKKEHIDDYSGMLSRVIQHEVDHLNGKYFTDYLSTAKRTLLKKQLTEISKTGNLRTEVTL